MNTCNVGNRRKGKQSTNRGKTESRPQQEEEKVTLYFQDFFRNFTNHNTHNNVKGNNMQHEDEDDTMDAAEIFFELANAAYVGFKIEPPIHEYQKDANAKEEIKTDVTLYGKDETESANNSMKIPAVIIQQDNSCETHTGGIVWETSYLLALYLKSRFGDTSTETKRTSNNLPLGRLLEVGSGCGMLGLILSSSNLCNKVVMTETNDVMPNLIKNVEYNTSPNGFCLSKKVSTRQLRWDAYKEDIKNSCGDLQPHSFDTIVGTDVIFTTSLVKPLLKTLRKMSHEKTKIYLCVQVRCVDSHALFLKKAARYGFECSEVTEDLKNFEECRFGLDLDCKLFLLQSLEKNVGSRDKAAGRKRKCISDGRKRTNRSKK